MSLSREEVEQAFASSPLYEEIHRLEQEGEDLPQAGAKRHHFNPQFLLRRFLDEGRDRLCQLHTTTGKPQVILPQDAASRRWFYTLVNESGERDNRPETYLALVDGHAAEALGRFLDEPTALAPGDRATLAYFFALLGTRTPHGVERLAGGADVANKLLISTKLANPEAFARHYREIDADVSDEEIEEMRETLRAAVEEGRIGFEHRHAHAVALGLAVSSSFAAMIYVADWTLLSTEDSFFVTSDTGLSMFNPTPRFPWSGDAWFSSPDAQTTIPLSRSHCLLVMPGDDGTTDVVEATDEEVDTVNLRTYGWATDYIYGQSQQAVVHVRQLAKERPFDVPTRRPDHHVLMEKADEADTSLADQHERRGWPRYLHARGERCDYVVLDEDGKPMESGPRAARLALR